MVTRKNEPAPLQSDLIEVSVLVIDDDEDIRELIRDILATAGCSFAGAGNGADALDLLKTVRPRLILLDLNMPVMDGIQFREKQRGDPAIASIPTVVMSAVDRMKDRIAHMGVERILNKPVDLKYLLDVVERYCDSPAQT